MTTLTPEQQRLARLLQLVEQEDAHLPCARPRGEPSGVDANTGAGWIAASAAPPGKDASGIPAAA